MEEGAPRPTPTKEGPPRPRPREVGRREDEGPVGRGRTAQSGPGKLGTRQPSPPVRTESGQQIRLAQIQAEAWPESAVKARPRWAKAVCHVREDMVSKPRNKGCGSQAGIQLAGGYPVVDRIQGESCQKTYGRGHHSVAERGRESPDPRSLSLSSL